MDSVTLTTPLQISPRHYDKRISQSIEHIFESSLVIFTVFSGVVLARLATHRLCRRFSATICYFIEFPFVVVPGVLFVTVAHEYSLYFTLGMILVGGCFIGLTGALPRARNHGFFDLGKRSTTLTIGRAMNHLITAICILAIDFQSFYRPFRKSKLFGAQLMDTGIGFFVMTMGVVSQRPRNLVELRRNLLHSAAPLILLGFARTVAIAIIGYGQDEHEYGKHLNAFFTLGLTKLFGSLLSYLFANDSHLLPAGLGLLVIHQFGLIAGGLSDYVMDEDQSRDTFVNANREGLFSLPGFVAMYIIWIYMRKWFVSKTQLSYADIVRRLWQLCAICALWWSLAMISLQLFGISRVTCNLSYALWMTAMCTSILLITMFIFDFIISSVLPMDTKLGVYESLEQGSASSMHSTIEKGCGQVNLICESLNMNGLCFFLLANVLTGGVNFFLYPENRSDASSVFILLLYMFLATFVIFQLYRKRIRIA